MAYRIRYSPAADRHMRQLTARQQATILDTVERQLATSPFHAARNRKRLRPNPLASWALRIGDLRVYYRAEDEDDPEAGLVVVAIGVKDRNIVRVEGEELEL